MKKQFLISKSSKLQASKKSKDTSSSSNEVYSISESPLRRNTNKYKNSTTGHQRKKINLVSIRKSKSPWSCTAFYIYIRIFYEFILIDTNLVSIKHFKDTNDPSLNTHSTIQILKVLQPRQFGTNLNQPKKFSTPFDPIGYTYCDYVDAWTNVLWHQNSKFKHSWLIYFKTNTVYNFPNWLFQWWDFFGPTFEIYPEQVQHGFS